MKAEKLTVLYSTDRVTGEETMILVEQDINDHITRMAGHCQVTKESVQDVLESGAPYHGSFRILHMEPENDRTTSR